MTLSRLPGFVDLQVNGFLGVDFSSPDLTESDIWRVSRSLQERGTAGYLATVITSPREIYRRNLPLIAKVACEGQFSEGLLGLHLEGPFISDRPGAVGAHNPDYVHAPDVGFLESLVDWSGGALRLLTVAAEVPGVEIVVERARELGIAVSIGHSLFDYEALDRMSGLGATALTHLGNGLPNRLHRHRNPIWAGAAHDDFSALLITDGHHLPRPILKTLVRAKGVARTIVVSDASPIAGMPPGRYRVLGNEAVLEPTGRLYNPEKACLVGSTATMLACIQHLDTFELLKPEALVKVGFGNPLRLIGIDPDEVESQVEVVHDGRQFIIVS